MAGITPKEILDISEPIEAIYQNTVDELLINIARHFDITGWERTRYWEIKKLSEMGALTKESAAIIAANTKRLPSEVEKAFLEVANKACKDIDPQLRQAAEKGVLQNPDNTPLTSVLMRSNIQAYIDNAVDTANMINTTMLASTQQAYARAVNTAVNAAMLEEAKQALEVASFEVVTGVETRTRAIRKAMNALVNTGIVGFYDKAGKGWHAEAYASMVIRTTAHNAAITAIKTRQEEYGGGDIFQVSSHPAARPLCYPYQGKFFSWSSSGEFKDGAGHTHKYDNINNSSYGEPAGLFGINCGHHPIPMIPNFSYPQDGPEMSEAENRKAYEESQKQRQYERDIREAKRDLEIAKATGDTDAIKAAEQKVAQKQANMRAYLKETGRPRRYDREKIAGTKDIDGFKGYMAQFGSDIPLAKTQKPPVASDPEAIKIIDQLKNKGIKYKEVQLLPSEATEAEIIARVAGGDNTSGSCASAALAYIGQKNGFDVLDFRDGESRKWFSGRNNKIQFGKIQGVDVTVKKVKREAKEVWSELQALPLDREYMLCTGKHAAIVKNTAEGVKYLELQSSGFSGYVNGWYPFENNPYMGSTAVDVLRYRFKCRLRVEKFMGIEYEQTMALIDAESLNNDNMRAIFGYLNTAEGEQKKGTNGTVK